MAGQRDESGEGNLIRYQERSDTKGGFFFFFLLNGSNRILAQIGLTGPMIKTKVRG